MMTESTLWFFILLAVSQKANKSPPEGILILISDLELFPCLSYDLCQSEPMNLLWLIVHNQLHLSYFFLIWSSTPAFQEQAETEIRCLKFGLQLESGSTPSKAHTDEKDTESCNVLHYDPNDSMYLVGGYDGESCLSAFDAYYPSQDMIKPLRPMSSVRSYASVAQLNGDLYVIGGGNGHVWYDTGIRSWSFEIYFLLEQIHS